MKEKNNVVDSGDREIRLTDTSQERAPVLNFSQAYSTMVQLIRDQTMMVNDSAGESSLKDLQLTRAKAQNYLEAVFNIVQLSHLHEIVESDKQKFKRRDEMEVMNPLLRSLRLAAIAGEKSLGFLTRKLDVALEAMENPVELSDEDRQLTTKKMQKHLMQTEMISAIQSAHTAALDNINKIVTGLTRVIQLERFSGARPWGIKGGGLALGEGPGEGGNGIVPPPEVMVPEKPKRRELGGAELVKMLAKKDKYQDVEADYDVGEE